MEALKKSKILIIDDEEDILLTLKMLLKKHVGSVFTSSNPYHIPRLIRQNEPDLILLDLNFKSGATTGEEGLQWLKKLIEEQFDCQKEIGQNYVIARKKQRSQSFDRGQIWLIENTIYIL